MVKRPTAARHRKFTLVYAVAGIAAVPGVARAQDARTAPDTVVVTASRTGGPQPGSITVVTGADLERIEARSVLEALNGLAGVRAVSTGGTGGSFVSIRGGEPNFTSVSLDGIRVNNPTNSKGGAFDFALLGPDAVASVTVAREANSAIQGSDALAGLIDISIKAPSGNATNLTARLAGGTDLARLAGATMETGWGDGGVIASGSRFDSGDATPGMRSRRSQGLLKLQQTVGDVDLGALGLIARSEYAGFPEDSGGPLLAVNRATETGISDLRLIGIWAQVRDRGVRPEMSASYMEQRDQTATPAIAPGVLQGVPAITADNGFSSLDLVASVAADIATSTVALGGEVRRERGSSVGSINFGFPVPTNFALRRTTVSGFAEATLRPTDRLTLNLAGRYDDVAGGPSRWSGRAGLSWKPTAGSPTLFARIGQGFKLPSLYALGHPLIGNPALRPEQSRSFELGAEMPSGPLGRIRLAVYDNRFRDLIDFDPTIFKTVNRDSVGTRGVELEGEFGVGPQFRARYSVALLDIESTDPLRNRPKWQASTGVIWSPNHRLQASWSFRFNSAFTDSSVPTGFVRTDGHIEVDAGVSYRVLSKVTLAAALRNLAGSRHQEAVGFPNRGSSLRVSLLGAIF